MTRFELKPSQVNKEYEARLFDVSHAIIGASVTNTGLLVTTTAGDYAGYAILATSAGATMRIYDDTAGTGKLLDIVKVAANTSVMRDFSSHPIRARIGIYVSITLGTGVEGTVFYAPRG